MQKQKEEEKNQKFFENVTKERDEMEGKKKKSLKKLFGSAEKQRYQNFFFFLFWSVCYISVYFKIMLWISDGQGLVWHSRANR